jgi:hypothetical protein
MNVFLLLFSGGVNAKVTAGKSEKNELVGSKPILNNKSPEIVKIGFQFLGESVSEQLKILFQIHFLPGSRVYRRRVTLQGDGSIYYYTFLRENFEESIALTSSSAGISLSDNCTVTDSFNTSVSYFAENVRVKIKPTETSKIITIHCSKPKSAKVKFRFRGFGEKNSPYRMVLNTPVAVDSRGQEGDQTIPLNAQHLFVVNPTNETDYFTPVNHSSLGYEVKSSYFHLYRNGLGLTSGTSIEWIKENCSVYGVPQFPGANDRLSFDLRRYADGSTVTLTIDCNKDNKEKTTLGLQFLGSQNLAKLKVYFSIHHVLTNSYSARAVELNGDGFIYDYPLSFSKNDIISIRSLNDGVNLVEDCTVTDSYHSLSVLDEVMVDFKKSKERKIITVHCGEKKSVSVKFKFKGPGLYRMNIRTPLRAEFRSHEGDQIINENTITPFAVNAIRDNYFYSPVNFGINGYEVASSYLHLEQNGTFGRSIEWLKENCEISGVPTFPSAPEVLNFDLRSFADQSKVYLIIDCYKELTDETGGFENEVLEPLLDIESP